MEMPIHEGKRCLSQSLTRLDSTSNSENDDCDHFAQTKYCKRSLMNATASSGGYFWCGHGKHLRKSLRSEIFRYLHFVASNNMLFFLVI